MNNMFLTLEALPSRHVHISMSLMENGHGKNKLFLNLPLTRRIWKLSFELLLTLHCVLVLAHCL